MKTLQILIFMFLFLVSCGGKEKSNVKLNIDLSALTGAGAGATGGLLLVGHKMDDSVSFSRAFSVNDPNPSFELTNGRWEFFVSFWDGSTPLTGSAFCAYAGPYDLKGTEQNISFNTTKGKCTQAIPDGSYASIHGNPSDENTFPFFSINSCLVDATTCSDSGLTNSFYVTLTSETKGFPSTGPISLKSNCLTPGQQLTIPSDDAPGSDGGIFTSTIYLFTTSDCTGNAVKYEMKDGLQNNITQVDFQTKYTYTGGVITLNTVHNLATSTSSQSQNLFGNGAQGDNTFITAYSKPVLNFSPDGHSVNIPASSLQPGDEVMWYVIKYSTAPSDCGPLQTGQYGFQRVKSKTTPSYDTLEFFKSIKEGVDLSTINYANCFIQIVKVPNYNNLDITSPQSAPTLGSGTDGGILVARVKGELTIDASISAHNAGLLNAENNVDYSDCNDPSSCLKMGFSYNQFNGQGGGIVLLLANKINFRDAAELKAGSDFTGTHAGSIQMIANEIYSDDFTVIDQSLFNSNTFPQTSGGSYDYGSSPTGVPGSVVGGYYNVTNASSSSTSGFTPIPVSGMPFISSGDILFLTPSNYILNPHPFSYLGQLGGAMGLGYCGIAAGNNAATISPSGVYSQGNLHNGTLRVNYSTSHCP